MIKSRRMRWAGHVARILAKRDGYRLFVGMPGGKGPPGLPRRRAVENIQMDLGEMGWVCVDWISLAQDKEQWEKKLHGLSPRANYTDRAAAACRRSACQLLRIEGATWSE
jgi:hypothetical protein